jgi:NAD(P)-dependent dehydrogenase (short-subunit alcohol dehydrogenase family)
VRVPSTVVPGVVIITGGSRGIGAATAGLAARRGWSVGVGYRDDADAAAEVVAQCEAAGVGAVAVRADVTDEVAVVGLFDAVTGALGPVTALVNNAGIVGGQGRLDELPLARLRRVLAVNVVGAFLSAREAVRRMSTRRGGQGGCIVNISSRAAVLGSPGEYIDYAASKGAVDTLTVGLAREVVGEGIRVNGVRPGIVRTELHASGGEPGRVERVGPLVPMGRAGEPDEVAAAIVWLMSDEASYVTGAILDVGGGR